MALDSVIKVSTWNTVSVLISSGCLSSNRASFLSAFVGLSVKEGANESRQLVNSRISDMYINDLILKRF